MHLCSSFRCLWALFPDDAALRATCSIAFSNTDSIAHLFANSDVRSAFEKRHPGLPLRMELREFAHFSLNVLVVRSGGREHVLVSSMLASALSPSGDRAAGQCRHGDADCSARARKTTRASSREPSHEIDLAVIIPAVELIGGDVVVLRGAKVCAVGPARGSAMLEKSRAFCKAFMRRNGIATASYARCTDFRAAQDYVRERGAPIVVKADGLVAGKGFFSCSPSRRRAQRSTKSSSKAG